jgi:excisionase family DNA binding protein
MDWRQRRFLEVKDLYAPDGPFEGLVKKDLCYRLLDEGKILSVRVGGRRLVLRESVEEYLNALIEEGKRRPAEQSPLTDAAVPAATPRRRRRPRPSRLGFRFVPPQHE